MSDTKSNERAPDYTEARTWAIDRDRAAMKWARAGWITAACAGTIAVLEAFALLALLPLKTVVPYTLLVDRTTGYTETLKGLHPQVIKPDSALTKSLLAQFVVARESYDISSIKDQYRRVGLWSTGEARREYLALMPANNPDSPINRYPRGTVLQARVSSVDSDKTGKARVRFITEVRSGSTQPVERTWWAADIDFTFTAEPMSAADRLENPLGFSITRYRKFQETPPIETRNAADIGSVR